MGASVAWARNDTDKGSRFELHDLNLAFPDKELRYLLSATRPWPTYVFLHP